jgi:hypothetical protein
VLVTVAYSKLLKITTTCEKLFLLDELKKDTWLWSVDDYATVPASLSSGSHMRGFASWGLPKSYHNAVAHARPRIHCRHLYESKRKNFGRRRKEFGVPEHSLIAFDVAIVDSITIF